MKKLLSLFVVITLTVSSITAQVPEKLTYQAVVRNANNSLVVNAQVSVRVNILQGSATGNAVYSESHVTSSNANGLITVDIGGGTVLHGSITEINWADGPYFLKTDIDPNGGNDYTITSVQQLLSVPYALYAKSAANGFSGDYNDLSNRPQIPQIPQNVSAFTNDAGYITMDSVPSIPANVSAFTNDAGYITSFTEQQILTISNDTLYLTGGSFVKLPAGFDGDYNNLTNKPNLFDGNYNSLTNRPNLAPVATSGAYNDLTGKPNLSPVATSGDYNDLSNRPQIPQIPQNVSAFTNDAGYITMDSVPSIPANVSAFTNDAGYITSFTEQQILTISNDTLYLTGGSFVKLPTAEGFSGSYNDLTDKPNLFSGDYNSLTNRPNLAPVATSGEYNDLSNRPQIPQIPQNVSAFTNDVGYITNFTEQQILTISNDTIYLTGGSFVKLPASFDGDYNNLTNKPNLFDGNYNSLTNRPNLAPVATSGEYNDLSNRPQIPQIPQNVSAFTNDAGYITMDSVPSIPANVSAFTNDVGYITSFTEQQILTISNDTIYLTGGSFVKLPTAEGFSGSYNDLTDKPNLFSGDYNSLTNRPDLAPVATSGEYNDLSNRPQIPQIPQNVSAFTNDAGYITMDSVPSIPANVSAFTNDAGYITSFTEQQILTISNDTLYLTGGSFVKLPAGFDGDYNSLTNKPADVSAFNNDVGYITEASCNGMNICEMFNRLNSLQAYVDSLQESLPLPETQALLPTVKTAAVSDITESSAICGGNVISDGGSVVSAKGVCWNTTGTPTISDNHTIDGGGKGAFRSDLRIPTRDTTYYVRAYATNSAGTSYGSQMSFTFPEYRLWSGTGLNPNDALPCQGAVMITDHEGNAYNTMQIGNQCWMRENLRHASGNEHFYWPDVLQACPTGWHIPSTEEWWTLGNYITPLFAVNFGDGGFWTSTTQPFEDSGGNQFTLIQYPSVQSNSVGFGWGQYEVSDVADLLSVRCIRDVSNSIVQEQSLPPTVTTAAVASIVVTPAVCGGNVISDGGSVVSAKGVCWNTTGSPTLSDNHTIDGGGVGAFLSNLYALSCGTTYYIRAYATNSTGTGYGSQLCFSYRSYQSWDGTGLNPNDALPCQGSPTVTDHEGNVYNTVQIGNQCWTRENMRCTTSPSTGTTILEPNAVSTSCTGKKAYYVNGSAESTATYGLLYNWNAAVDTFNTAYGETSTNLNDNNSVDVTFSGHRRGICPVGWHVPSDAEWSQLKNYVSSQNVYSCGDYPYNIAKALVSTMWEMDHETDSCAIANNPSTNNATGFSAVPVRHGDRVDIWSSTQYDISHAIDYFANYYYSTINKCITTSKDVSASVRCLRD